jgi:uncharacterized membrane protein YkvA (DUF1232 family)
MPSVLNLRWAKAWRLWRRDGCLLWRGFFHPARPWWLRLGVLLLLAYVLLPLDVLPDWIPILGQLDDVLLLGWGVRALAARLPAALRLDLQSKTR